MPSWRRRAWTFPCKRCWRTSAGATRTKLSAPLRRSNPPPTPFWWKPPGSTEVNNPPPHVEGDEDFASMLEESFKGKGTSKGGELKENEIVRGTVVQVTKDYAVVDIGYKSEGQVPIQEFGLVEGKPNVKVGDAVEVLLESRENDTGMVVLSKEKADKMRIWDEISAACERDELVEGTIVGRVKGGLSVDIGVKAFLPRSQVDLRPIRNLAQLIGETVKVQAIQFNKKRGKN